MTSSGNRFAGEFDRDCMREVVFISRTGLKKRLKYDVERDIQNFKDHSTQVPVSEEMLA